MTGPSFDDPEDNEARFVRFVLSVMANRTTAYGRYKPDGGQFTAKEQLTEAIIRQHFRGEVTIGLHTTSLESTCQWCLWDFDAHAGE